MFTYLFIALILALVSNASGTGAGLGGNLGGTTYKNPYASKDNVKCETLLALLQARASPAFNDVEMNFMPSQAKPRSSDA
jgi:hypothetical protein